MTGTPILIRNAHLFDPSNEIDLIGSVFIRDGRIADLGPDIDPGEDENIRVLDANECYLFPAFCDPHVHFRTPGQTEKEDLESGSRAALAGGFTTVIQMPNTSPVVDNPEVIGEIIRDEPIELRALGAVTMGLESRELTDFAQLQEAGASGFTDDGNPVVEPVFMRAALNYGKEHGVPVASHSEDTTIGLRGIIRSGIVADSMGVPGWNPRRESSMVERDIELAKHTGGHVHFCHVSTAPSVEAIRKAKAEGVNVTAEATPHHLALTVNDVPSLEGNGKMNPPLASSDDLDTLIRGLEDGTIDCIATDHAPHTPEEKARNLEKAPFGVIGLETSFGVCYTELVLSGRVTLPRLIEAMTVKPRDIYHLEQVGLIKDSRADLVLIDLLQVWPVIPDLFESKARNCPFAERQLTGKVLWTIYRGDILWHPKI